MGVSFAVYSDDFDKVDVDRNWQLDIIPRTIKANIWREVDGGLKQRCRAINLFIQDVYNEQAILKDNVIPRELVVRSPLRSQSQFHTTSRHRGERHAFIFQI